MHDAEEYLGVTAGVGRVDVAPDHVVVHQAVDDVGGFLLGRADHRGVEEEVPLVDERVGTHTLALPEILVRVIGVERIDAHLDLLAVAGG